MGAGRNINTLIIHSYSMHCCVPGKQRQQEGITMALVFMDQRSNNNKDEEPKQEDVNQGLKEATMGSNSEGAGGCAGGANIGNTGGDEIAGSGEKKHSIGATSGTVSRNASTSGAGVGVVIQVPPPVALVEEPGTPYPRGWALEWGWAHNQEPSKNHLGPINDVPRSFLPCPSFN
jgi:hypothetical protein